MTRFASAIATLCALASSTAVLAASPIQLSSDIYVEKLQKQANGQTAIALVSPKTIVPGDQLIFVVNYRNTGNAAANNIVVTNPIPRAITFSGTSDGGEVVSVDGGKNWGKLAQLRIASNDGSSRAALMTDVTHVKWQINQSIPVGSAGKLIFRGVVK